MQTVVYARYSSHLQNARSIEDQINDCRARASREGWEIVDVFTDYAISGAAGIENAQRPGLGALLSRVDRGGIEQVLTESTDRIARHQGDDFAIRERLQYAGVRLFTLMEGEVDDITGTIKGLMNARFRKDLGERTKRGQRGAVAQGRAPAGLAYGYRRANRLDERGELVRGLRDIDPERAAIVHRIFFEYAAGKSPRAIAEQLNYEQVPAPRGATWRGSTILGDRQRKNGMLNNWLYAGVLVHNRTSKIVDPRTRKTLIRPNPENVWVEQPVPELAIIDRALWDAVHSRRGEGDGVRPEHQRRPKHLLSGLGRCGKCGGGWIRQSHAYWGCGRRKDGGGCDNRLTTHTDVYEREVLARLQSNLLHPDLVATYVREYHLEHARRSGNATKERAAVQRKLTETSRKFDRLVEAIATGGNEFAEIRDVLAKARQDRESLARQLEEIDAIPVLALHPGIADQYRREVQALQEALAGHEAAKAEAVPKLRALIERITLTPNADGSALEIQIAGRMHQVISLATGGNAPAPRTVKRTAVR